jgi:hypothetical protein
MLITGVNVPDLKFKILSIQWVNNLSALGRRSLPFVIPGIDAINPKQLTIVAPANKAPRHTIS